MQFEYSAAAQSKLMTPEQYSQIEHPKPYTYTFEANGKVLYYMGSSYPTDPADPTFMQLEEAMERIQPEIVLVGNVKPMDDGKRQNYLNQIMDSDMNELISRRADIGFMVRRAKEHGIEWLPLEPADAEVYEFLEAEGYQKREIYLFRMIQELTTYQRLPNKPDFTEFKRQVLQSFERKTEWEDFDYTESALLQTIQDTYGEELTLEQLAEDPQLKTLGHPGNTPYFMDSPSRVNEIWSLAWAFRDKHAIEIIAKAVQEHDRIMVLYGASHAVVQEEAVKGLLL